MCNSNKCISCCLILQTLNTFTLKAKQSRLFAIIFLKLQLSAADSGPVGGINFIFISQSISSSSSLLSKLLNSVANSSSPSWFSFVRSPFGANSSLPVNGSTPALVFLNQSNPNNKSYRR